MRLECDFVFVGVRGSLGGDLVTGVDGGFVRPEALTNLGVVCKRKNTKLGTEVNIYLGCEKKSQQITILKKKS